MKFYQRERLFTCNGKTSTKIWEVAPEKLTINPTFNKRIFKETMDGDNRTPFNEISIVPFNQANPDIIYDFNIEELRKKDIHREDFANTMFNILCDTIY